MKTTYLTSVFLLQSLLGNILLAQVDSIKTDTLQVNVDGHSISMYVSGLGKYTIVLEAGGASNHRCWRSVYKQLAKMSRTVSYDRPGYLKSGVCEKTRDAITVATELNQALSAAGLSPPYILVGWSLGGAYMRAFCGLFPKSVAGLVLVEPAPEEFYPRINKEHPELLAEDSAYMAESMADTKNPGKRGENMAYDASMDQARSSDVNHSTPTTLLIATHGKAPGKYENDPTNPVNVIWVEELKKWAGKRPNLTYQVIDCDHHIAQSKPDVVIKAISLMVK